jgi:hypothetical protein
LLQALNLKEGIAPPILVNKKKRHASELIPFLPRHAPLNKPLTAEKISAFMKAFLPLALS